VQSNKWADSVKRTGSYPLLLKVVSVQALAATFVVVVAGMAGGVRSAMSAAAGGACCVVPNAWLALRLWRESRQQGGAQATAVLAGEFIKVTMTVAMMVATASLMRNLNWWAFVGAIVVALKSSVVMLMMQQR
jgi:ATP synthase protein I